MDSDYVAGLLMSAAAASSCGPGLDHLGELDGGAGGGFLETLCGGAGFVERAARLGCGGGGGGRLFGLPGMAAAERGGSREGSSVSDPAWAHAGDVNARKRKAPASASAGKGKEAFLNGSSNSSPCKVGEANGPDSKKCKMEVNPKVEEAASDGSVGDRGQKQRKGKNSKPAVEPPKDYVHVRARRGQATDSHSLAERVRREKISQRMKLLQDLVPGCNKVVGKALMLDEIINYVQSLQQQVEFLSMKLATVNPQLDFSSLSTVLHKDMYQACGPSLSSIFPLESAGAAFPFCDQVDLFQSFGPGTMENQCTLDLVNMVLPHTDAPQYAFQKQQRDFWEDSAFPYNNDQSQEDGVSAPNFDGSYN
ncbi:hypothetical protein GUJ93_ZPchr0002g23064 [Zizania palustris]|uniref:BHLH domain-containing protein n=1 Tax=Zizania palustris TaxID=103762 RepID=A0A8J5S3M5_ZIZPA|nr:hypothetical protein GUJ93_ZPchr0002g23064 [Zizania palustris]